MYSFEGTYKRKTPQSFAGSKSTTGRESLLQQAKEERQKREHNRQRAAGALKIQSYYRGFRARQQKKDEERQLFDVEHKKSGPTSDLDLLTLTWLCRRLVFFYDNFKDSQRLTWLCQQLVHHSKVVRANLLREAGSSSSLWYMLPRVLAMSCQYVFSVCEKNIAITAQLRLMEVYCCVEGNQSTVMAQETLMEYLIDKGYFSCLRKLFDHKVPEMIEETIPPKPPNPLAETLYDLVTAPLLLATASKEERFRNKILQRLAQDMFLTIFTPPIPQFLLPALIHGRLPSYRQSSSSSQAVPALRLTDLLQALVPLCCEGVTSKEVEVMPAMKPSPWLLYTVLRFASGNLGSLSGDGVQQYLQVLNHLFPSLNLVSTWDKEEDEEEDSSDSETEEEVSEGSAGEVKQFSVQLVNDAEHVRGLLSSMSRGSVDQQTLMSLCTVCHCLLLHNKLAVHKSRLLYSLAFQPQLIRALWTLCSTVSTKSVTGSESTLLSLISRAIPLAAEDMQTIIPVISVFCSLFSYALLPLHDSEFTTPGKTSSMPFTLPEIVTLTRQLRDVCLGIIELAHPETRPELQNDRYKKLFESLGVQLHSRSELDRHRKVWARTFKIVVQLVKHLYTRDTRQKFCPPGHWLAPGMNILEEQSRSFYRRENMFVRRPFGALGALNSNRNTLFEDGPPLSTKEARKLTILQELPFAVAFEERVLIFSQLISEDRKLQQGPARHWGGGPTISLSIRRNYLYEDAFEKLSPENEPNLRQRVQVQLQNFAGANEAGIDGGGLFREFMWELLKTGFDPTRGFFSYTTDKLLYPNPDAPQIINDCPDHYFFLGRMLGKALYENMLVELPFASFFLSKILSHHRGDVDIHHLASLDPDIYRNLLYLKNYEGNVEDLQLDFTVAHNQFGQLQVEELKPNGRNIAVTSVNCIEYMHLLADYMLNRRIRAQTEAFRKGLADVINIEWLRMFNHSELQVLISGAQVPISTADLKEHTNYSGGFTAEHHSIFMFWQVVEEMTDLQRRQLLKFVTSCSRPPLLGFKDLYPAFCIHSAGRDLDRLPTASTCMNLLKMPEFDDIDTLRQKLVYAIESGAGFELS